MARLDTDPKGKEAPAPASPQQSAQQTAQPSARPGPIFTDYASL
jgi:hypothetical protein